MRTEGKRGLFQRENLARSLFQGKIQLARLWRWVKSSENSPFVVATAYCFCLGVFVLHLATRYLQIDSYAFGKTDTALYEHGLWLIGQLQMPVSLAYQPLIRSFFQATFELSKCLVYSWLKIGLTEEYYARHAYSR
jgi:hypothetical protein